MQALFLKNHYDLEEIDLGYQFVTITGTIYFVTFINYPTVSDFLSTKVYMFNIERGDSPYPTTGKDDVMIRNTILFVLDLFFQQHEYALITICDVIDGKQSARKRLFDNWYRKFNDNRLIKLEADCFVDDISTTASLLFSANHYDRTSLQTEFQKLVDINFYS